MNLNEIKVFLEDVFNKEPLEGKSRHIVFWYDSEEDFIEEAYIMEVSSPGLGRPLKKEKDYKRSMGKELEIRTYRAVNREKEFYGILTAYDENSVTIDCEGEEKTFQKSDIALIRLAFDF